MTRDSDTRQYIIAGSLLATIVVAILAGTAPLYAPVQPGSYYGQKDMARQLARQAFYEPFATYNQQLWEGNLTVAECARYETTIETRLQGWDNAEFDLAGQSKVGGDGARWIDAMYDPDYGWDGNPARVPITNNRYAWYHEEMEHPLWTVASTNASILKVLKCYCTPDDPFIVLLAGWIKAQVKNPQEAELVADALLSFVQDRYPDGPALNYIADPVERPKYPMETLYEWGGDDEDSSILLASLAKACGLGAALVLQAGHCMAAVELATTPTHSTPAQSYQNKVWSVQSTQYWICECTTYGYRAGDLNQTVGASGGQDFIVI